MKKIIFTLGALALSLGSAFAQDAVRKAAEDAAAAIASAPVEEAPAPAPKYWTSSIALNLGFNNTILENWAAGGYNTMNLTSSLDAKANYKKELMSWNNRLQLDYGFLSSADKKGILQKSNDRIYLESKWAYQTAPSSKLNYTASFDFRSQFTDTPADYKQMEDGTWMEDGIKSGFISPAYTNLALGIQWTPSGFFDINIAPLTGGFTIVTNQALRSSYGMKELTAAVKDAEGVVITPATYSSTLFQFGAQVKANFKLVFNKNLKYETQAVVFTDYIKAIDSKEAYFRINWDNSIDWQLSRFVKCSFKTWLISDPNVTVTKEDGSVVKRGVQFKEFLSFNFTYTFATK